MIKAKVLFKINKNNSISFHSNRYHIIISITLSPIILTQAFKSWTATDC